LKVREYTYTNSNNTIEFTDECSECGEDIEYKLNSTGLFYEFPDDELIEKYWDAENEKWIIDPSEYGLDSDEIILYTPKLGKDEAILEWATNRVRSGAKLDETFIKFVVWMLPKIPRDTQLADRAIQKAYKEYKSWDIDTFTFMNDVVNNITINPSEKLRVMCPHCSQEATSNVQFPNGIKVLFETQTRVKKFGTR
jgi:hypothetical protein